VLGFSARCFDTLMFVTIVIGTVIGVKAVGLVLMVAFVVTPPAAARQWTRTLPAMVMLSAGIGAVGSGLGAYISIALGPMPTGPGTAAGRARRSNRPRVPCSRRREAYRPLRRGRDEMSFVLGASALAVVTAVACALPGVFVVLRKNSMLVDAISHAVLPGIV